METLYVKRYKRCLDVLLSLVSLPIVLLICLVTFPLIWLEDRGSPIYVSKRIGKGGRLFNILKLRTMRVNAPDIRLEDGSTYNAKDDPRVTKVGKVLRETSIDELPQVLNVLLGHMSIVGPRPDPPDWLDMYTGDFSTILKYRPGITGYNQVEHRNKADGETKMKNDLYYAKNCSFKMDVMIIARTVAAVFSRRNTYV